MGGGGNEGEGVVLGIEDEEVVLLGEDLTRLVELAHPDADILVLRQEGGFDQFIVGEDNLIGVAEGVDVAEHHCS